MRRERHGVAATWEAAPGAGFHDEYRRPGNPPPRRPRLSFAPSRPSSRARCRPVRTRGQPPAGPDVLSDPPRQLVRCGASPLGPARSVLVADRDRRGIHHQLIPCDARASPGCGRCVGLRLLRSSMVTLHCPPIEPRGDRALEVRRGWETCREAPGDPCGNRPLDVIALACEFLEVAACQPSPEGVLTEEGARP